MTRTRRRFLQGLSLAAALLPLAACGGRQTPSSIASDLTSAARLQKVLASLDPSGRWVGSPMQMTEQQGDVAGRLEHGRFVHGLTGTLRSTVDIASLHGAILADAEAALSAFGASLQQSASIPVFSGQPLASPELARTTVIVFPRSAFQGQWSLSTARLEPDAEGPRLWISLSATEVITER